MSGICRCMLRGAALLVLLGGKVALAAEGAEGGHEPQLLPGPNVGLVTAITTLVIFALLLAVLGRFAWGPIAEGLRTREQRIRKEIADAEAARAKADALLKEYNDRLATAEAKVRQLMAGAKTDAEKIAAEIRARGEIEAEDARKRATTDIEAAGKKAVREVYEKAAEIATNVAEKILRRHIVAEDQRDLVNQGLEKLQETEL